MINHTVLFKLKEEASEDQIQGMIDALQALSGKIDELKEIQVKKNFSDRSQGYSVILFSLFEDKAALDRYQVHPAHVEVVGANVKPILESLAVADIEY
ncbi:Dabb family protein [Flammeovirga kamogawensis]|uniref:Dabb family protein n=1 Tax=Flammeovirga kamogawensis TaxID=373891 RepID=A0ABX8GTW4_9BACT|nr:Dabb family protein [Flammeovirga kamogawensis]MBB6459918.1 hypothetical protein [Flammeovirga kamogawensis]QWG07029.1 Dabb family protein [Flammeovirga kamogawensis]TRX68850.1 Dabb family protein [Flammeovirga kamogawensis]